MLYVKTPEEVLALIETEFENISQTETVSLADAMGRVLAEDITATEYVPDFNRSTVDGYAVCSVGNTNGQAQYHKKSHRDYGATTRESVYHTHDDTGYDQHYDYN